MASFIPMVIYLNFCQNSFTFFRLSVPAENFTRDGIHDLIVYTVPVETSKVFFGIGFALLILSKLNVLQSFKIQSDDTVPLTKLPKVS